MVFFWCMCRCVFSVCRLCRVRKVLNGELVRFSVLFYYISCLCSVGLCVIIVLFIILLWLLMYLVVECSIRFVLNDSGCCSVGDRKVLLIIMRVLVLCVVLMMKCRLVMCSSGLDGVFISISFGWVVNVCVSVCGLVRLVVISLKWFFLVSVLNRC